MREIKFRGKRKDNGEWVEGSYVYAHKWFGTGKAGHFIMDIYGINRILIIPETIGQYTGLEDKNGKEIYEGDIVKATISYNDFDRSHHNEPTNVYEVKYKSDFCFYYLAREGNNLLFDGNWSYYLKKIEVIGNIHDNPELLEGKDNPFGENGSWINP